MDFDSAVADETRPWRNPQLLEELGHILLRRTFLSRLLRARSREILAQVLDVPTAPCALKDDWTVHIELSGGLGCSDPDKRRAQVAVESGSATKYKRSSPP